MLNTGIPPRARGRASGCRRANHPQGHTPACAGASDVAVRGFDDDDRSLERVEPLIDPAEPLLHRSHPLVEPVVVLLHLVVQAVDPRAQFGSCPIDACPEFASHVSQFGPHRPDFSLDVPQLVLSQQVSGSSPLAGSNRINNLQGFRGISTCGCVGTMWANRPLKPARASTARQHRERPRPTPPLSRLGGRCLPFDRVWPTPISSSATLQTYAVRRHTAQPGTSRHCRSGGIPRLRGQHCETPFSRSGYVQHSVTNHPTAGCRYRPTRLASASGIVAPFPPRAGTGSANGSRRYPRNPNQWFAGRLRLC